MTCGVESRCIWRVQQFAAVIYCSDPFHISLVPDGCILTQCQIALGTAPTLDAIDSKTIFSLFNKFCPELAWTTRVLMVQSIDYLWNTWHGILRP